MKKFLFLFLIFCFGSSSSQNMYTNEPDLVYPILEEFIAENFKNHNPSFYRINQIDSIIVEDLGYIIDGPSIRKVYGRRFRIGNRHTVKVDSVLLKDPKRFERTLKHELGHVFDLPHLPKEQWLEFMSSEHWLRVKSHYNDPETWNKINHNYYQSLIPQK